MRRALWGVLVALGLCLVATSTGRAQVGNAGLGVDPFSLYFGWYLPNQAYQAAQPRPQDTINANAQQRQFRAMRDRGDLFDVQSPFGGEGEDLFGPYAPRRSGAARAVGNPHQGNVRGMGPRSTDGASYFQRTGRYFPQAQRGGAPNGPNKNIYVHRAPRGGGGGMGGMSSMPGFR